MYRIYLKNGVFINCSEDQADGLRIELNEKKRDFIRIYKKNDLILFADRKEFCCIIKIQEESEELDNFEYSDTHIP